MKTIQAIFSLLVIFQKEVLKLLVAFRQSAFFPNHENLSWKTQVISDTMHEYFYIIAVK